MRPECLPALTNELRTSGLSSFARSADLQKDVGRAGASALRFCVTKRENRIGLAKPPIHLGFQHRSALRSMALSVHNANRANAACLRTCDELLQFAVSLNGSVSVKVECRADRELPSAELLQDCRLHAGSEKPSHIFILDICCAVFAEAQRRRRRTRRRRCLVVWQTFDVRDCPLKQFRIVT